MLSWYITPLIVILYLYTALRRGNCNNSTELEFPRKLMKLNKPKRQAWSRFTLHEDNVKQRRKALDDELSSQGE